MSLIKKSRKNLSNYQILAIGFAFLIFVGTALLMLPHTNTTDKGLPFIDALFTATSAVCVTGLIVVDTGTYFNAFGQMIIIFLIQSGGLGIMAVTTMLIVATGKQIDLQGRLLIQESLNQEDLSGMIRLILNVIKITFAIEFIAGTILALRLYPEFGLRGIYMGYWHAVSAFCNAGFDLFGNYSSLTNYVDDWTINLVICSLIILGGLGFTVILEVLSSKPFKRYSLHSRIVLRTTFILIVLGAITFFFLEQNNPATLANLTPEGKFLASLTQSISPRTAGFNSVDLVSCTDASLFLMIILMFIGASPTSTGGGIKTTTFAIIVMSVWTLIKGKRDTDLLSRRIDEKLIFKAMALMVISFFILISATFLLTVVENAPFIHILFEVTSAFGTVGLSSGVSGNLSTPGKVIIILVMFAGRVGPLTLALALVQRKKHALVGYPSGKIMIG